MALFYYLQRISPLRPPRAWLHVGLLHFVLLLTGCAAGGGGGGGAAGGMPGTACTPAFQAEGCYGQVRVLCDPQTSLWQELGTCAASQFCTTAGAGAASVAICQKLVRGDPTAKLYAGIQGQPCQLDVDVVGCDPDGNVSTCTEEDGVATWQPMWGAMCQEYGEQCVSGMCGAVPVAYCRGDGGSFSCPGTISAGIQYQACNPKVNLVGCDPENNVSTCKEDANGVATWKPLWGGMCSEFAAKCVSGMCGTVPVAYCSEDGSTFGCPGTISAGIEGQACNPKVDIVGCDPDSYVSTCNEKDGEATWQSVSGDSCKDFGAKCMSGMCGTVPVAKCIDAGATFVCE